jgi:hypothetical protein
MKTIVKFLIFVSFLIATNISFSQEIILSGTQTKTDEQEDTSLNSKAVKLEKSYEVTEIWGENLGFWISGSNGYTKNFYYSNDDSVIGLILKPGTYRIYPNFKSGKKEASVSVKLLEIKKRGK